MLHLLLIPAVAIHHGHVSSLDFRPPHLRERLASPRPDGLPDDVLPDHLDWRNVGGVSYVTADVNQHIPQYCGSCWIHGTTAALNDRIKLARRAAFPDAMLSRQALMNCVPSLQNASEPPPGCDGGDAWMLHTYLSEHAVGDESCLPYEAKNGACDAAGRCRNCVPDELKGSSPTGEACWAVESFSRYGVREYGQVAGETAMMKEIYARGPIVCSIAADEPFMFEYAAVAAAHEGVYVDRTSKGADEVDHEVEIAGWGVTPGGVKYWVARNSWGTYWGEGGWFRALRGENALLIEGGCDWAVPTYEPLEAALDGKVLGDYIKGPQPAALVHSARPQPSAGFGLPATLLASDGGGADSGSAGGVGVPSSWVGVPLVLAAQQRQQAPREGRPPQPQPLLHLLAAASSTAASLPSPPNVFSEATHSSSRTSRAASSSHHARADVLALAAALCVGLLLGFALAAIRGASRVVAGLRRSGQPPPAGVIEQLLAAEVERGERRTRMYSYTPPAHLEAPM